MNKPSKRAGAPESVTFVVFDGQVEMSTAMVAAGERVLADHDLCRTSLEFLAETVFRAMCRAAMAEKQTGWMNAFAGMAAHRDRLEGALARLVWAARISGGVAGRDDHLCSACDEAELAIKESGSGRQILTEKNRAMVIETIEPFK